MIASDRNLLTSQFAIYLFVISHLPENKVIFFLQNKKMEKAISND